MGKLHRLPLHVSTPGGVSVDLLAAGKQGDVIAGKLRNGTRVFDKIGWTRLHDCGQEKAKKPYAVIT